uniref:Uncharacterized protein n=1 Tax=Caenorhabditis japonica TaxID=281687 RepID=A0A8R1IKM7_CAEJA
MTRYPRLGLLHIIGGLPTSQFLNEPCPSAIVSLHYVPGPSKFVFLDDEVGVKVIQICLNIFPVQSSLALFP